MNANCVILLSFSIIHISCHLNITQTVHHKLVIIPSSQVTFVMLQVTNIGELHPQKNDKSVSAWMKRRNTFYSVQLKEM